MSKSVLSSALAAALSMPMVHANTGTNAVIDAMTTELKSNGSFTLPGFGTFKVHALRRRKSRNPSTGESVIARASRTVRFKPSPNLRVLVAKTPLAQKAS